MWWLWFLVGFMIGCAATSIWFIVKLLNCKIEEGTPSASHNRQITKPAECGGCTNVYAGWECSTCGVWIFKNRQAS